MPFGISKPQWVKVKMYCIVSYKILILRHHVISYFNWKYHLYVATIYRIISMRKAHLKLLFFNCLATKVAHLSPDSKVHGANMGPTWVLSAPDGPHVGPMNLAIRVNKESPFGPHNHLWGYILGLYIIGDGHTGSCLSWVPNGVQSVLTKFEDTSGHLGLFLLTQFNFNLSMDE